MKIIPFFIIFSKLCYLNFLDFITTRNFFTETITLIPANAKRQNAAILEYLSPAFNNSKANIITAISAADKSNIKNIAAGYLNALLGSFLMLSLLSPPM